MKGDFGFLLTVLAVIVFAVVVSRLNEALKQLRARTRDLEVRLEEHERNTATRAAAQEATQVTPKVTAETDTAASPPDSSREEPPADPNRQTKAAKRDAPDSNRIHASTLLSEHPDDRRPARAAFQSSTIDKPASDPLGQALSWLKDWFSHGNVPVKVGVLVSFVGVAALLRYAAAQGWLSAPIEFRLIGISLVALGALAFAWRQRHARRLFSLAVQGGAIGTLILTVFAAFRLYQLIPTTAAFALLLILVAATGALALLQNALSLGVLALVAGFAAPILVTTGEGSHIALFSYYALLNLAVLGVTWYRPWPLLNRLGFAFTFIIGTVWGVLRYQPEHFASTFPFLVFFSLLYLLVPIRHALNQPAEQTKARTGTLDVAVVFGLPLFAFPLFAALFDGERLAVALCSAVIAVVYALVAWLTLKRFRLRPLGDAHLALAVGFATLAVPIAFTGPTVTLIWALEGAALVWIGLRQQERLAQLAGLGLQGLATLALLGATVTGPSAELPILNGLYMGALAIAFAGLFSAWRFDLARTPETLVHSLAVWGIAVWALAGVVEIERHASGALQADLMLALAGLTAGLGGALYRWRGWPVTAIAAIIALATGTPIALAQQIHFGDVVAGWSAPAWGLFLALAWLGQRLIDRAPPEQRLAASLATHAALLAAPSIALYNLTANTAGMGVGWQIALGGLPVLLLCAWLQFRERPPLSPWPLPAEQQGILRIASNSLLLLGLLISLQSAGDPSPLIYLPILNPLEIAQLAALALLLTWKLPAHPYKQPALAGLGLLVVTAMTLRATHHFTDIPWNLEALLNAPTAQAAVTVLWTILGVTAWVLGSRRGDRPLWWCGAALLGLVLAKLLLIDRLFLSNMAGIISFLAFGLLSILVGYLAPAPPEETEE
ncbi:putative membrane protein [Natronospira proteinivora]|uniref:Membrane protein n=1 Tax=Natronospira proteinivora TaxID=1807133 RepID=A0ABT1GAI9_9GAMM|nr:DUF2339 domain-containing protein [Natronospira proteinivora]MCP1728327.1 putative membrane protein [Natronospira proteinivora]